MNLTDKVAAVTGGASGIGAATVKRLREQGAAVALLDVDETLGKEVAAQTGAQFLRLDVTDRAAWSPTLERVVSELGGLDVVHLNAGIMTRPPEAPLDDDILEWVGRSYERLRSVNLDGVVYGIEAAVPLLEAQGGGSIVVTASISGLDPTPIDPFYTASKHAVVGLVRSIAPALEPRGIRINALCPGAIDTAIVPEVLRVIKLPLLPSEQMADAVMHILESGRTGVSWVAHKPGEPIAVEPQPLP